MKSILCNFKSNDSEDLKEHYIVFHEVDCKCRYFINLFMRQNKVFRLKKCLRYDEFLLNQRFKVNHDFLVHYGAGRDAFEEKSVNYTNLVEIKYDITIPQHS